jgi:hypothetical protein
MELPSPPDPTAGYAPDDDRPLASYSVLTATFGIGLVTSVWLAFRRRGELPESYGLLDIITIGIATHKVARLISKDKVTAFMRAPFTRYQEPGGPGELEEEPRGEGLRYAVGELLVCPYCIAQWIVAGFAAGMVGALRFPADRLQGRRRGRYGLSLVFSPGCRREAGPHVPNGNRGSEGSS